MVVHNIPGKRYGKVMRQISGQQQGLQFQVQAVSGLSGLVFYSF